jgi:hypothetical protein
MIKTAIINAKTGETEYKELDITNPIALTPNEDLKKIMDRAKIEGWI